MSSISKRNFESMKIHFRALREVQWVMMASSTSSTNDSHSNSMAKPSPVGLSLLGGPPQLTSGNSTSLKMETFRSASTIQVPGCATTLQKPPLSQTPVLSGPPTSADLVAAAGAGTLPGLSRPGILKQVCVHTKATNYRWF